MAEKETNKKLEKQKKAKRKKLIIISAVLLALIITGIIVIPKLITGESAPMSITTYNVEAVTYGDVDTTITSSGSLTPITKETVATEAALTITEVNYAVGDEVDEGEIIVSGTNDKGETVTFAVPYDCVILELPVAVDDSIAAGAQISMLMGRDGFTMGIAVSESDIAQVEVGQEVEFTLDAVSGEYTGAVTAVSYNGTQSGGTTAFQITAEVEYIEGAYPGMSTTAEIVIDSGGDGLLVPVSAVKTSGDDSYIYLAPSGSTDGQEYGEEEIDLSSLTKVVVETGKSDGSYIRIDSDEISEGTLIVIETLTSTQTGSASDDEGGRGGFGGMGGGFPGGGRGDMNFEDFDFENFDPGNMPSGGFGGMGGGGFPGGN